MKLNSFLAKAMFGAIIVGLALWSGLMLAQRWAGALETGNSPQPQRPLSSDARSATCHDQDQLSAEEAAAVTNRAILDAVVVNTNRVVSDDRFVYALEMNNGAEVEVDACTGDILAIRPAAIRQNQAGELETREPNTDIVLDRMGP